MHILVTGATGFFGGNLLRMLCDAGHVVRYLSRNGQLAVAAYNYPQAVCCAGDLNDVQSLRNACDGIDWIFHAAAIVSSVERDRKQMQEVNVEGTKRLFEVAKAANVRRFIYISTVDTIGIDPNGLFANEETIYNFSPLRNPYSDTKKAAEDFLISIQNDDIEIVVVNPGFMIGGFDTKGSSSRIINEIMHFKGLFAPNGGNSFVGVKDVCRGAIQAAEKGKAGERYILAGHNLTYRDFFSQVSNLCNRPKPLAVLPRFLTLNLSAIIENASLLLNRKPMITRNDAVFSLLPHYYSSNKAERELGYVIHPLESAIKDTIDCYSNRS